MNDGMNTEISSAHNHMLNSSMASSTAIATSSAKVIGLVFSSICSTAEKLDVLGIDEYVFLLDRSLFDVSSLPCCFFGLQLQVCFVIESQRLPVGVAESTKSIAFYAWVPEACREGVHSTAAAFNAEAVIQHQL